MAEGLLSDVLPSVFSASDRLKRRLDGLLSDPIGTIEQSVRNFGEDQNKMLISQSVAYPLLGSRSVLISPEQRELAQRELADYGAQVGLMGMAIDPKAQKLFEQSLIGKTISERYRLGDIKPSQASEVIALHGGNVTPNSTNIFAQRQRVEHVRDGRIIEDGYLPAQIGNAARQAMKPDAVVLGPSKPGDYPALFSQRVQDPVTGRSFNGLLPLKPVDDGFDLVTVIPKGLPRKNKTPKK